MILVFIEGFVLNFVLLLVCTINIRNGAVGGVITMNSRSRIVL